MTARALVLIVCALALAGCGETRPGAAAVVDGTTISMAEADRTARVFCRVTLLSAAQQGVNQVDNAEIRRQAVTELIAAEVAEDVAEREGLDVDRSDYAFTATQRDQVEQSLPDADADTVVEVLEAAQRTYVIAEKLGEQLTGQEATPENAAELQRAGRAVLAEAQADAEVRIDPRFGLDPEGQQVAESGSLSVAASEAADGEPAVVPATQRCA